MGIALWLLPSSITHGEQVATVFMHDPDGDGVYTGTWRTLSSYTESGIYSIDMSATDTWGNDALVKAPEVEITRDMVH